MTGQGFNPPLEQAPWDMAGGFAYRPPTHPLPGHPTPGSPSTLRPHIALDNGEGILTFFPSTTLLSLALGADSPCSDERRAGNLGLTATGLFTLFNATHVSIRTSDTSSRVLTPPSQAYGTLPYHCTRFLQDARSSTPRARPTRRASSKCIEVKRVQSAASVHGLSPVTSSAQDDSISELLRFL